MEFFIQKIFDGETDELVHLQFQKFSKGEFKNRAMIVAKQNNWNFSISTTPEYANEFVRCLAEKLGDEKTIVSGIVVSTRDLERELNFQNKKQFMGIKQYTINKEMSGNEILELCDKLPNSFIGLSFKVGDSELKIKPKAPKSAKPSAKVDGGTKVNFCKLKTSDNSIVERLIFEPEARGFKQIGISHDFIIDEIVISDEMKEKCRGDFGKTREMARRKGRIVRRIRINEGEEIKKEVEFEA